MKFKIFILNIFLIGLFNGSEAQEKQEFLDKEFYLVDSIPMDGLDSKIKHELDSVLKEFHTSNIDTAKINKAVFITVLFFNYNRSISNRYIDWIENKLSEIYNEYQEDKESIKKFKKLRATLLVYKAFINDEKGNNEKAIELYRASMAIGRELQDTSIITTNLNNLAGLYLRLGEHEKSIKQYDRVLELSEQSKDTLSMIVSVINIGMVYGRLGKIEEKIAMLETGLKLSEKKNNEYYIAAIISRLATEYGKQGDIVKQEEMLKKAINISNKKNDVFNEIKYSILLANLLLKQKKYVEVKKIFEKYISSISRFNDLDLEYDFYIVLGDLHFAKEELDSAQYYYDKIHKISNQTNSQTMKAQSHNALAQIYLKQGDVKKAYEFASKAKQIADSLGYPVLIKNSAMVLHEITLIKNDFKSALEMYKIFILMRDSLQNESNKKATYKQQMKYEYEKKEEALKAEEAKRILEAEKERKVRNTIIIGIGCGLGLSLVFLYYLYGRFKVIRKQKHLIEEQSANLKSAYNELHELQQFKDGMTGMIVHDLKNPLNAMLGYAEEVESVNLKTRIRNTSRMMLNYVLNMLDVQKFESKEVPLDKAEQPFSNVLQSAIEQIEFLAQEKNITLENKVKRNYIVILDAELVSRVLVNLLTNAIKYSPNKSTIILDAHAKENNQLEIMVADQGQGIPKDMLSKVFDKYIQVEAKKSGKVKSTGLGLTFCKLVAEGHGGSIWVESEEGKGSQFYFTVPLVNDAGEILQSNSTIELTEKLSTEELIFLEPIKKQLSQLDVMDSMEIMEVLEQTRKSKSMAINSWANQVENAVLCMDEELFKQLID